MARPFRYALVVLLVAALTIGGRYAYLRLHRASPDDHSSGDDGQSGAKPNARLVVLVVFDQMRGDYLSRWADHFSPDGFDRMKKEGVWYSNVEIPYSCTSTGPGHASISTGAPPVVTGIVENDWFDRKAAAIVYCAQPHRPYELVPPIPAGEAKASRGSGIGFAPDQLLAETVADKLKATHASSKVVSLSIKDRTAVMMGGRKPDAVYCFDTRDGKFHTDAYYREQAHPWVTEFNAAGMVNEWFNKSWDLFKPKLDYKLLTGNPNPAPGSGWGISQKHSFPHPMDGGLKAPGPKFYEAVETSPYGNELLFALVKKAIAEEKLGTGEHPDLLCISFSSNDLIGHNWGPDSWEVLDITLRSDKMIADFLGHLDATIGKDRYTLLITADHGVCPIPEQQKFPNAQRVRLEQGNNEIFTPLTKALNETFGVFLSGRTEWFEFADVKDQARVWPWIYLNTQAIEKRGLKVEEVGDYVRNWLAGQPFIEAAYTRTQLESESFPIPSIGAKVKLAFRPDRCGDVIAIPKPGVLITPYSSGTNHGTPHAYDSHVPVLVYGSGIPKLGTRSEKVSSLIVAPILAHSLGIEPPANAGERLPGAIVNP